MTVHGCFHFITFIPPSSNEKRKENLLQLSQRPKMSKSRNERIMTAYGKVERMRPSKAFHHVKAIGSPKGKRAG